MCNQALEQQEAELASQLAGEREAQQAFTLEEVLALPPTVHSVPPAAPAQ